jgi:hypothetical protein
MGVNMQEEKEEEENIEGFDGEEHVCEQCDKVCTCDYDPCVCCSYDW